MKKDKFFFWKGKMWKALQEVDGQLFAKYWCFATNILRDDLQQQNAFDCAVFFCCFARSLVLQSPVPDNSIIHNFSVVDSFWHYFPFSPHPIRSPVLILHVWLFRYNTRHN